MVPSSPSMKERDPVFWLAEMRDLSLFSIVGTSLPTMGKRALSRFPSHKDTVKKPSLSLSFARFRPLPSQEKYEPASKRRGFRMFPAASLAGKIRASEQERGERPQSLALQGGARLKPEAQDCCQIQKYKGEEKLFATEEISSIVLSNMRQIAEAYLGSPVKNAVITVPAFFTRIERLGASSFSLSVEASFPSFL
ncbi:hypothetical protein EJ110_NYTH05587 [Nymphaea thermarum]|nr:hypothetical protein EJ110_NYTH05587 [Nymphaea thermarum]